MSTGFPSGHFLIKSLAADRVLDVELNNDKDGALVIAWPELESSWVEGFRNPIHDNQVFFVDETGALCSKASGHALDVEDHDLVLRHRRPMTHPFPNYYSHALPRFQYSQDTGQISVIFSSDPIYAQHTVTTTGGSTSSNWLSKKFVLTTLPMRRERSLVEDATDFITSTTSLLTNPVSNFFAPKSPSRPTASITAEDVSQGNFDLREDEVLEQERAPHEELDDSSEQIRHVRVLELPASQPDIVNSLSQAAQRRTQWKIIPIMKGKARTNPG